MPPLPSKDDGFRPNKKTGVWSTETTKSTKQKSPEKLVQQAFDSFNSNDNDDDEINVSSNNVTVHTKSKLINLLTTNYWVDIGSLLHQFNDEDDLKEEDTVWTQDYLFVEITNKFGK